MRVIEGKERRAVLERICVEFDVAILYAFGSRAEQVVEWLDGRRMTLTASPSDVDIGVKSLPDVIWRLDDKVQLALQLEDLFDDGRVDLIVLNAASPFLAEEVIRGERLYAQDEYLADEYDLYILRRAGDLAPLEREWLSSVLQEQV